MKSQASKYHYTYHNFIDALYSSGIKSGDILFGHSSIGFFGKPCLENLEFRNAAELILSAIFYVLGDSGTLVLPSYTYSFCKSEIYDPKESKGIGGALSETLRKKDGAIRSLDPSISVIAKGKYAKELTRDMPINAYSDDGIFGRLLNKEAKICNFNFDASSTFIHYVEKLNSVPYRFFKNFNGKIRIGNDIVNRDSTIYVRYLHKSTEIDMKFFDYKAIAEGVCQKIDIGRGFIKTMNIKDQKDIATDLLKESVWSLTRAGNDNEVPDINKIKHYK